MLQYKNGDLFTGIQNKSNIVIPHVTNKVGAWGSGFVIPLGKRFPKAELMYRAWAKECSGSLPLGKVQMVEVEENIWVANMVAQESPGSSLRPLRYNSLSACMDSVASTLPTDAEIHCPMFGSGLAGGNWFFVEELIRDCWIRKDIPVTVHYLPQCLPEGFNPETRR